MAADNISTHVLVIGAGVQGCITALKLVETGASVILLELANEPLTEASSKLEGWLHHGTYHAAMATTAEQALRATSDCLGGAAWYREHFADCISSTPAIALTNSRNPKELEYRWAESGVDFSGIADLSQLYDYVSAGVVSAAYQVPDASIDVDTLREALARRLQVSGVQTMYGVRNIKRISSNTVSILNATSHKVTIYARTVVLATGIYSNQTLHRLGVSHELRFRLWRSHLLQTPRLNHAPLLFYVDYDKPSLFPQGLSSLIGLNSDNQPIASTTDPANEHVMARFTDSFKSHFGPLYSDSDVSLRACYKVDIGGPRSPRSVGIFVQQLEKNVWLHLPGKMTTAPVASDRLRVALDRANRLGAAHK